MVVRTALLYDADCGFCKWCTCLVLRLDRRRLLQPVALQEPAADELLGGMDEQRKMASWHLVAPDGTVSSAGAAFGPLGDLLPFGAPLASLARRFPQVFERGYRFVADNRDRFGRLTRGRRDSSERCIERFRSRPAR